MIFDPTLDTNYGYIRCSLCLSSFCGGYPSPAMHIRQCPDYEISTQPPYDHGYKNCIGYFSRLEITDCKELGHSRLGFITRKVLEKYYPDLLSEDPKTALSCELSLAKDYLVHMRSLLEKAEANTGIEIGIKKHIEQAEVFVTETTIKLYSNIKGAEG